VTPEALHILEVSELIKDFRGLRPLRIERLSIARAEQVAVIGLDQAGAETFVNLITGASLPDRGEIRVFGRSTAAIEDSAAWLALVDRLGLVTDRAVLLEPLTIVQNLALPFSLDVEPLSEELRAKAVGLAREVGVAEGLWEKKIADIDGSSRARIRLGRALALDPDLLLLEHPTAAVEPDSRSRFARDVRAIAERRGAAALTLTADPDFARTVAARVLALEPSTGKLREERRWSFLRR
jgi:ABC-type transporter Mla maintaining outer membrane lipid asymmetry ATPase subunit MlaF